MSDRTIRDQVSEILVKHKMPTRQIAINDLVRLVEQTEKAYGACHKCFGKGYTTYRYSVTGSADFEGDVGFTTPFKTHMIFCSCDRGKQLSVLVPEYQNSK